jgi:hypothetical protein
MHFFTNRTTLLQEPELLRQRQSFLNANGNGSNQRDGSFSGCRGAVAERFVVGLAAGVLPQGGIAVVALKQRNGAPGKAQEKTFNIQLSTPNLA